MSEVLAGKRDELSGFSRVDGERIEQVRDCRTRTPRCGRSTRALANRSPLA